MAKAGLVPAAPSIMAIRAASRMVPSAASGEKETAIWSLPIHTPWGSASERERDRRKSHRIESGRKSRCGKTAQGAAAAEAALCVLYGAHDNSGVRATQACVSSVHRNSTCSALWGPGGHMG